jgi:hypothetical protein
MRSLAYDSNVSHVALDEDRLFDVSSFTATLLPAGRQPGDGLSVITTSRKVTSPFAFYPPIEGTSRLTDDEQVLL